MKKISALIIDDESDARENVIKQLEQFLDEIEIIGEAADSDTAEKMIRKFKPDLLFLDIAMPRRSGFDLLSAIPDFTGEVIFITSFNQYAEDAFRYLAIGYLIKPLDTNDFSNTVSKTISLIQHKQQASDYSQLLRLLENKKSASSKIVVPTEAGYEVLDPKDVYYFESQRNYTSIICENRKLLVSKNIAKIEQWLSPDLFMRIHRSYIVNLKKIKKVDKNGIILLENEDQIKFSKQNKDEIVMRLSTL